MNGSQDEINQGPVYEGYTASPTYDALTLPPTLIDNTGFSIAPGGNQDLPKPNGLDSDEPRIIDRKKD